MGAGAMSQSCFAHGPIIEIDARCSSSGGMKSRVDIIRPSFGRGHLQPTIFESPQQAESDQGFAAARLRCGDDKTFSQSDWLSVLACTNQATVANLKRGPPPRWQALAADGPQHKRRLLLK